MNNNDQERRKCSRCKVNHLIKEFALKRNEERNKTCTRCLTIQRSCNELTKTAFKLKESNEKLSELNRIMKLIKDYNEIRDLCLIEEELQELLEKEKAKAEMK